MAPQIPKTYKAAVIVGQQKPLEIQELPIPELKENEVLVKVLACGVCHSDHHVLNGDMGPPCVLGPASMTTLFPALIPYSGRSSVSAMNTSATS